MFLYPLSVFQVHFESGAVIIREGEVGDTFFIISGGSVEVRSWRPLDGKEEGRLLCSGSWAVEIILERKHF